QPLASVWVSGEELSQRDVADLLVVTLQRAPGGARAEGLGWDRHGAHRTPSAVAFRAPKVAHCSSMWAMRFFHPSTKLLAALSCSLAAGASTSTPARRTRSPFSGENPVHTRRRFGDAALGHKKAPLSRAF